MRFVKPKLDQKIMKKTLQIIAFLAVISQMLVPFGAWAAGDSVLATISQNEPHYDDLTLKEAPGGRLVMPHMAVANADQPDRVVKAVITAYTSTPDQTDDSPDIAAWGDHVYDGMIAANWLPRGTKVKIPSLFGDKIFTVADRMNPRYGFGRIDIWFDATKSEARKFGVKRADLEIYYPEKPNTELAMAK